MTVEIEGRSTGYARLDWYADLIVQKLDEAVTTVREYMESYFNAAKEENITEEDAKRYLRSKIPNSTFYKFLPSGISKREKSSSRNYSTVEKNQQEESSTFNTKGMGVVVSDDEEEIESTSQSATGPDGNEMEVENVVPDSSEVDKEVEKNISVREETLKIVGDLTIQELKDENAKLKAQVKELAEAVNKLTVVAPASQSLAPAQQKETVFIIEQGDDSDIIRWVQQHKEAGRHGRIECFCYDGKVVRRTVHKTNVA